MKYIPFSEVFEKEFLEMNGTRIFSNNLMSDQVYGWRDETISFSKRKTEIEKMNSHTFKIITHLFMIYYPMSGYESDQYVKKNVNDLFNNWFSKMTTSMIKVKLNTSVLHADIDKHYLEKLHKELVNNHKYGRSINVSEDKVVPMWNYFCSKWNDLITTCTYYGQSPNKDDYYKILEDVLKKLKYVKINNIPK